MDEFSFVYIVYVISNGLSVVRPLVKALSSSILGQLFMLNIFPFIIFRKCNSSMNGISFASFLYS